MGTYIPEMIRTKCFELNEVQFVKVPNDSHTALALQTALELGVEAVYIIGYDGYQENAITQQERALSDENEYLFGEFASYFNGSLSSLTPTRYQNIELKSIYALI